MDTSIVRSRGYESCACSTAGRRGFTLLELLVVVGIVSLLTAISLPILVKVRRRALTMQGMKNQRQIVDGVNFYAMDNENRYPPSVATIGSTAWNWQAPFVLTGIDTHAAKPHRAMSEYLRSYIPDARTMFCPNAPRRYKHLQQAWDAGDAWNNPDTLYSRNWVKGSYCFYWNYTGLLDDRLFTGPRDLFGGRGQSRLLVSCYFGYNLWRREGAFGSCERYEGADITPERPESSAYWSRPVTESFNLNTIEIKLNAGYTDGHVESFSAPDVTTMKVILDRFTYEPYEYGPGYFYLPVNSRP
ncbi:MAG: type II secretion system protein [Planctomycetota bacterium]